MALLTILSQLSPATLLITSLPILLTLSLLSHLHSSPLSHLPGPLLTSLTSASLHLHTYLGTECTLISTLHARYGPITRLSPTHVAISDGATLSTITTWPKADCYGNFDFDGFPTIFSARDVRERGVRAKAVLPVFSLGRVREGRGVIEGCVGRFVGRLGEGRGTVDVLGLCRGLATDSVCAYLFGKEYGALGEGEGDRSAEVFVKSVVDFGRFFYLPTWAFGWILGVYLRFFATREEVEAAEKVDEFIVPLVEGSEESGEGETYQGRLLRAGISKQETVIQVRDVIFAGTDSTGTNLATLVWRLAKHKDVYAKLKESVGKGETDYTDAVVRETLRLAMANPTRKPRVVPPGGWTFVSSKDGKEFFLPSGTLVGLQDWTLHHNPEVFPDPHAFVPERWLGSPKKEEEMKRDWVPFNTGTRQCIARNLAFTELMITARMLAEGEVLNKAECVDEKIEVLQWVNSKIKGDKVELVFR